MLKLLNAISRSRLSWNISKLFEFLVARHFLFPTLESDYKEKDFAASSDHYSFIALFEV